MCTVTIIPFGDGFIVTSNRDENPIRAGHRMPVFERLNNTLLLYPQDSQSGGTWFVVNEYGAVGVVLNGAFESHQRLNEYRLSRGIILLQVLSHTHPETALHGINLEYIEPFTLVLLIEQRLVLFKWDGYDKYFLSLDPKQPHIFSSVTLYDASVRDKRERFFLDFLAQKETIDQDNMLQFHSMDMGDTWNGFVMQRSTTLRTLSTTQVLISERSAKMIHHDLLHNQSFSASIDIDTSNNLLH